MLFNIAVLLHLKEIYCKKGWGMVRYSRREGIESAISALKEIIIFYKEHER